MKLDSNHTDPTIIASASEKVVVVDTTAHAAIIAERNTTSVVDGNTVNAGEAVVVVIDTAAPEMAIFDEVMSPTTTAPFKKKWKVHKCSICHHVFMSGQAFNGHK